MKKMIFGLIATVLIGNLSFGQDFKTLYEHYKKSTAVFNSNLNDFDNNLNGAVTDPKVFRSEEEFSAWLKDNITKTNYKDANEALKDYNEQILLLAGIFKDNDDFLRQINENEKEFLNLLADSPLTGVPINTVVPVPENGAQNFVCISECINGAVKCSRNADKTFSDAMVSAAAAFATGNPIAAAAIALGGYNTHSRAIAACRAALVSCSNGCK